ncbi:MAG: type II toxin-antitoxin system Phd/YefM family antitoxin [Acidimicrobiia bacterium]
MSQVGVRALKQNASEVVAQAAAGEVVIITDRGRPVAQLVPIPAGRLGELVAAGRARPAKASLRDIGDPARRVRGRELLSVVLQSMRDDERP